MALFLHGHFATSEEKVRDSKYEVAPLLETMFLSRDFYSPASVGTHIKPPVEPVVSTYRKMGLKEIPGVPDFNEVTEMLGQKLFHPPTVAGWAHGRSWITPGLLLARGNFVYDTVSPDINFLPPDRYPGNDGLNTLVPYGDTRNLLSGKFETFPIFG